jgi:4a-hydroxytetrahydrobiopterin dehydratase
MRQAARMIMLVAMVLNETQIKEGLDGLPDWSVVNGKLHRDYQFPDFPSAFGFMAAAATVMEALNHHAEWSNVWNKVSVDLVTHDQGGITAKDVMLARRMEALAVRA